MVKSAQELLKEKIEKVRQEDEKERQLDPEKESVGSPLQDFKETVSQDRFGLRFHVPYG